VFQQSGENPPSVIPFFWHSTNKFPADNTIPFTIKANITNKDYNSIACCGKIEGFCLLFFFAKLFSVLILMFFWGFYWSLILLTY
jgi:hypothetical protein